MPKRKREFKQIRVYSDTAAILADLAAEYDLSAAKILSILTRELFEKALKQAGLKPPVWEIRITKNED